MVGRMAPGRDATPPPTTIELHGSPSHPLALPRPICLQTDERRSMAWCANGLVGSRLAHTGNAGGEGAKEKGEGSAASGSSIGREA
ncbi:Os04g0565600 [Oryza sativa Japonica Group]|uniref:Os04g0565600 protein n=2 Tax=Oryza TaxID=4527 RepID=A0A0P0WDM9_ORYSJ|nr:Os04g0565600 [Oryza sativa Japonica Group]